MSSIAAAFQALIAPFSPNHLVREAGDTSMSATKGGRDRMQEIMYNGLDQLTVATLGEDTPPAPTTIRQSPTGGSIDSGDACRRHATHNNEGDQLTGTLGEDTPPVATTPTTRSRIASFFSRQAFDGGEALTRMATLGEDTPSTTPEDNH